jgi:hypothetical protein
MIVIGFIGGPCSLALVGGRYQGALSYESFPFDLDYLVPPAGPYDNLAAQDAPLLSEGEAVPLVTPHTDLAAIPSDTEISLSGRTNNQSPPSSSVADLISHIILSDASDESPAVSSMSKTT